MVGEAVEGEIGKCSELYDSGLSEEALRCYDEIVRFMPEMGIGWYLKGMCLYKLNRFDEAIACFEKAGSLDRDQYLPWQAKGMALVRLFKFEEAVASFKEALERNPRDVETMFLVAACFIFEGDEEKAREWVRTAMRFDPLKTKTLLQTFFEAFVLKDENITADEKLNIQHMIDELGKK
ncbi:MAG: tetratricopeptide repeat protein [Candidatus Micrarchaeia archaeon]